MHYYIDGYNMLFRLFERGGDLQGQRESLIDDLNKKVSFVQLDVSIVFDSTYQIGERTRSHYEALEIIYTAEGETADEYILEELNSSPDPQHETVVTSDKSLGRQTRSLSAHVESIEEFISNLNRIYRKRIKPQKKIISPPKLKPLPPSPKTPPQGTSLEAFGEFYQKIFEAEWQEMLKHEEREQEKVKAVKRVTRTPRQKVDPFKQTPPKEEDEATEMERWLKIFEKDSTENKLD